MAAKPTIDLILATDEWPWPPDADALLQEIGFYFYKAPNPKWRVYLKARDGRQRGYHLHIVEKDSGHWQDHLLFRDHLRPHPDDAQAYADLKLELARQHPNDPGEYQRGKAQLVAQLMAKARTTS